MKSNLTIYRECSCGENAHEYTGYRTPAGYKIYSCRNCYNEIVPTGGQFGRDVEPGTDRLHREPKGRDGDVDKSCRECGKKLSPQNDGYGTESGLCVEHGSIAGD